MKRTIHHVKTKGFTLIELLVVIAIIGVLSSVVLASLNSARGKARDARRKEDLSEIQKALELYYDTYGGYPSSACPTVDYTIPLSLAQESKMKAFIPTLPTDPRYPTGTCYDTQYLYLSNAYNDCSGTNAKATSYALYATLEDQSKTNLSSTGNDAWLRAGGGSDCQPGVPNYRLGDYN